jgi:hypothetical protein
MSNNSESVTTLFYLAMKPDITLLWLSLTAFYENVIQYDKN